MFQPSEERIKEFQRTMEEEYDKEFSVEEATEAIYNLVGFFDLLYKIAKREGLLKEDGKELLNSN